MMRGRNYSQIHGLFGLLAVGALGVAGQAAVLHVPVTSPRSRPR